MSTALAPLWHIEDELLALLDSVATCDAELLPELQAQIDAYMGQEVAKVDQIAHVLSALEYEQKAASDEIARLQERKRAAKAAQDRLEQYVCRCITARGVKALKGATNTLAVRASDAVVISGAVPIQFCRAVVTMRGESWINVPCGIRQAIEDEGGAVDLAPDKAAIKKALKAGEDVSGADLEFRNNLQRK